MYMNLKAAQHELKEPPRVVLQSLLLETACLLLVTYVLVGIIH